jgi:hypothetical protein
MSRIQRSLNHAVFDNRYTERAPSFAFGYVHTPYPWLMVPVCGWGQVSYNP